MDLTPEEAHQVNADLIRYMLADQIERAIAGWPEMRIAAHTGEIGGYIVEDAVGRRYAVRLTVTPQAKRK